MNKSFINADELAAKLSISKPFAYKLIRDLNAELKAPGYMTLTGKVSRKFVEEKFHGIAEGGVSTYASV